MSAARTFFALMLGDGPGAELARHGERTLASADVRARRYGALDLHLTLFFVGPLEEGAAEDCERELWALWKDADLGPAPRLVLDRTGAFPHERRPRILWAGLGGADVEPLRALQARLQADCESYGFQADPRPWTPHVTVARLRPPHRGLRGKRSAAESGDPQAGAPVPPAFWDLNPPIAWKPNAVAWVESLPPGGPRAYRVVREIALAEAR